MNQVFVIINLRYFSYFSSLVIWFILLVIISHCYLQYFVIDTDIVNENILFFFVNDSFHSH